MGHNPWRTMVVDVGPLGEFRRTSKSILTAFGARPQALLPVTKAVG